MKRVSIVALITAVLVVTSACASKGYVRKTVGDSSDALTARIETNESEAKESRDALDKKISGVDTRVSGVDSRVSSLDAKTTEGLNSVKGDVQQVDQRTAQARSAADRANSAVGVLDQNFKNRNLYNASGEKAIQFKFDSAKLDEQYMSLLDEIAGTLQQNPDAIVVLEGRTDSVGNKDYNVKLGERRIEAVRRYLAVEKNVPVYKIHEISFGSEKPVAENKTRDGREKNRAVVMTVLTPKADAVASRND
jgi:outer membrane protein OmpA-like peptidoglycan-associated protein